MARPPTSLLLPISQSVAPTDYIAAPAPRFTCAHRCRERPGRDSSSPDSATIPAPIVCTSDSTHLQELHRTLVQDFFEWVGSTDRRPGVLATHQ